MDTRDPISWSNVKEGKATFADLFREKRRLVKTGKSTASINKAYSSALVFSKLIGFTNNGKDGLLATLQDVVKVIIIANINIL